MQWLVEWAQTPGFGGVAAVLAAVIAGWVSWRNRQAADTQARRDRVEENGRAREARWSEQARWAAERVTADSAYDVDMAVASLQMLVEQQHDTEASDFAAAALDALLPPTQAGEGSERHETGVSQSADETDGERHG